MTRRPPFSIATTPICRRGRYTFSGLLDPYLIMLSVNQGGIEYIFWVFDMSRPGIEPRSPGPLAKSTIKLAKNRAFFRGTENRIVLCYLCLCKIAWKENKAFSCWFWNYNNLQRKSSTITLIVSFSFFFLFFFCLMVGLLVVWDFRTYQHL